MNSEPTSPGQTTRRDALKFAGAIAVGGAAALAGSSFNVPAALAAGRFSFEIDGVVVAGIQAIEGIESETEIVEYKDGSDPITHLRPGNHKPGKMVVTKDWSNTAEFYNWRKTVLDGKVERKSISIVFQNDAGEPATRMNFFQCWPTKWTGPALNAKNSGHATEIIEVVYEGLELK